MALKVHARRTAWAGPGAAWLVGVVVESAVSTDYPINGPTG